MTPSLVEIVLERRSAEQVAQAKSSLGRHEKDSWDVRAERSPPPPEYRTHCMACDRRAVRGTIYCLSHLYSYRGTGTVDLVAYYPASRRSTRRSRHLAVRVLPPG